jgi:hypothetical protein
MKDALINAVLARMPRSSIGDMAVGKCIVENWSGIET